MSKLANNGSNNTPIIRASQVDLSGKEYLFDWDKWTNKGFRKTLGMEYEYLADFFSQLNDMIVLKGNKKTKQPINKEPAPSKPEPKGKEPEPKEKDPEKKKKTEHKTTRERKPRPKVKIPPMPAMTPQQKERETDRVMRMHGVNVNNSTPERRQEISNFYGQFLDKTPDEISKILKDAIAKDKSHKLNPAVLTALDSAFTAYNPDSRVGGTQSKNAKDTFLKIMAELGSDNDKGRRIMMDVIPTEHMKIVLDAARSMDPNNSNKEFVMPYKSDLHNMGIDGLVIFGIQQALAKIDANDLSSEKASNMLKSARANIKEVREAYHDTYKANGRATKTIGKEATEASKFVDKEREKVNKELYKESVEKSIEEIRRAGVRRIKGATKGKGSILQGIQKLQQYEIIIDSSCINLITEFENYAWDKDKNDEGINKPIDAYNHGIDALRYSLQCLENKSKIKTLDKSAFGF